MNEQLSGSKGNPWMISTLVLAGLIVGFSISQIPSVKKIDFFGKTATIDQGNIENESSLTNDQIAKLADDDDVKGNVSAPITVVEFSDFQCPYCKRFFANVLPQIKENYIDTGKVKFIFRDFLIDGHEQAPLAALASECAGDQGKFWEMHDMLYAKQEQWSGNPEAQKMIKDFAPELGLDTKKFDECIKNNQFSEEIQKDVVDGISYGVTGTPSFFINGKEVSGALPYDLVFKPIFDAELAGKKWEILFDVKGKPTVRVQ